MKHKSSQHSSGGSGKAIPSIFKITESDSEDELIMPKQKMNMNEKKIYPDITEQHLHNKDHILNNEPYINKDFFLEEEEEEPSESENISSQHNDAYINPQFLQEQDEPEITNLKSSPEQKETFINDNFFYSSDSKTHTDKKEFSPKKANNENNIVKKSSSPSIKEETIVTRVFSNPNSSPVRILLPPSSESICYNNSQPAEINPKGQLLYTSSDIRLNQDGTIDRGSKAVKSGYITFNTDGSIDKKCQAVRLGYLHLNSLGFPDTTIHTDLEIPKNPGKHKTTVYRDPYQQKKFRKETNCPKDHDASHIVDLELAREILKSKPGRHPTEAELHQSMKPLNKLLEARPVTVNRQNPTNPDNDRAMARRIMGIIHGESVTRTRALDMKIRQMQEALHSIPEEEMNAQIRFVMKEIDRIAVDQL